ncbi:hypothetical protein [Streptomyces sp. bgisy027]|uniref:hypothetical protein n=1 Tax=Streptomyces sp. bgisy027 TaxID=3413770 RepID=UPI003D722EFF
MTAALDLAERISRRTRDAVATVKQIVHTTRGHDESTAFTLQDSRTRGLEDFRTPGPQDPISDRLMTSPQAVAGTRRFTWRTT